MASLSKNSALRLPDDYVPPTQPPSSKRPDFRKSQLLRTYTSMLRSTPLTLIFQHNNLTAVEWSAVRRELRLALAAVDASGANLAPDFESKIQLQVVKTRLFGVALKLVEFFDPATVTKEPGAKKIYNHDLSKAATAAIKGADKAGLTEADTSAYAQLAPLMAGPVALLTFPAISPAHLAAAISVLAPSPPNFKPPTRKKSPGYYDAIAQNGLAKLMLIGGRVEGKVFDQEGLMWVGGISGGLEGLRAQLVALLQSAGMNLTTVLEGAGKSLWLTMESRRTQLEEKDKPAESASEGEPKAEDKA